MANIVVQKDIEQIIKNDTSNTYRPLTISGIIRTNIEDVDFNNDNIIEAKIVDNGTNISLILDIDNINISKDNDEIEELDETIEELNSELGDVKRHYLELILDKLPQELQDYNNTAEELNSFRSSSRLRIDDIKESIIVLYIATKITVKGLTTSFTTKPIKIDKHTYQFIDEIYRSIVLEGIKCIQEFLKIKESSKCQ